MVNIKRVGRTGLWPVLIILEIQEHNHFPTLQRFVEGSGIQK